jgi:hypothetical protein
MAELTEETRQLVLQEIERYRTLQMAVCQDMVNTAMQAETSEESAIALINFLRQTNKTMIPEPPSAEVEIKTDKLTEEVKQQLLAGWQDYQKRFTEIISSDSMTNEMAETMLGYFSALAKVQNTIGK